VRRFSPPPESPAYPLTALATQVASGKIRVSVRALRLSPEVWEDFVFDELDDMSPKLHEAVQKLAALLPPKEAATENHIVSMTLGGGCTVSSFTGSGSVTALATHMTSEDSYTVTMNVECPRCGLQHVASPK